MSALNRLADYPTADGIAAASADADHTNEAGVYLRDEVFFYRVVCQVVSGAEGAVELEDCYWLDVVHVPVKELRARRPRVAAAAPVQL